MWYPVEGVDVVDYVEHAVQNYFDLSKIAIEARDAFEKESGILYYRQN